MRTKGHLTESKSPVFKHLKNNHLELSDSECFEIIDLATSSRLMLKEAMNITWERPY